MKLPIFIRILINLFFFFIYLFVSVIVVNFSYGFFIFKILNKPVKTGIDPIHFKMAVVVFFVVLFLTFLFRKYFYLALTDYDFEEKYDKKNDKYLYDKNVKSFSYDNDKNYNKNKKYDIKVKNKIKSNSKDDDMEIFIGKEIK